ncbi:zinc finger protein 862-like [Mercenaria mercenaria]|uniref:zinc finger protein 862-like n=1 Tax=Mercenaria mercenaria TaxID=6596 RepID=UPI00234E68B3|nr:zinc finger protein 862-like [Mercenaria mercenaria]
MPLKKQLKLDPKQQKLSGFLGLTSSEPSGTEEVSTLTENEAAATSTSENQDKKIRKFVSKWLTLYSWLNYDESEDYMYCTICTDNKKMNGMNKAAKNRNFQNTTLTRHVQLEEHRMIVEAPLQRQNLKRLNDKQESQRDKALNVLLKSFHWMCSENLPISKFKSMVDFMHDLAVPGIAILKQSPFGYDSEYTANELLDSLAAVAETDLIDQLNHSPFVTVLTDESTDLSNTKRLVLYAQLISEDMKPSTVFINNTECKDASGKGIAAALQYELSQRGVPLEKVMSLGSDGASVMTGKKNGAAAIMRRSNPHMVNIHCIAHRLALCRSQAAADIPLLHKHQQTLTDLFYYFKGSSKRESRLHAIQAILDDPCLTIKEIHSVRWLSYFNALETVFRTMDSIFTYLEELHSTGKDPKATGLKKKMATDTFVGTTYMLMGAMAPVTILSQFFQTENIDIALVKVKLDLCLNDLEKVKAMESPYCRQLQEDLQMNKFRGQHEISKTNFNLKNLT